MNLAPHLLVACIHDIERTFSPYRHRESANGEAAISICLALGDPIGPLPRLQVVPGRRRRRIIVVRTALAFSHELARRVEVAARVAERLRGVVLGEAWVFRDENLARPRRLLRAADELGVRPRSLRRRRFIVRLRVRRRRVAALAGVGGVFGL